MLVLLADTTCYVLFHALFLSLLRSQVQRKEEVIRQASGAIEGLNWLSYQTARMHANEAKMLTGMEATG